MRTADTDPDWITQIQPQDFIFTVFPLPTASISEGGSRKSYHLNCTPAFFGVPEKQSSILTPQTRRIAAASFYDQAPPPRLDLNGLIRLHLNGPHHESSSPTQLYRFCMLFQALIYPSASSVPASMFIWPGGRNPPHSFQGGDSGWAKLLSFSRILLLSYHQIATCPLLQCFNPEIMQHHLVRLRASFMQSLMARILTACIQWHRCLIARSAIHVHNL